MAFNKGQFEHSFAKALAAIAGAEKVTKEELRSLSRDILTAWHETGNVAYANKLLAVLSPMNKKTFIVFGKHFSGFTYDEVAGSFTKKSAKRYEKAHAECVEFLADPNNNIWSWAERHIEVKPKAFDVDAVKKYFTSALQKAQASGISEVEVLKAVLAGGVHVESLVQAFNEMEYKDVDGDAVQIPEEYFAKPAAPVEDAPM